MVWLAELDQCRPVIVLTRDPLGRMLRSVIVGPVISTVRGLSTEVEVGAADGIRRRSVVNLDDLQLVPRAQFLRKVGRAAPATMGLICAAATAAIGCDVEVR